MFVNLRSLYRTCNSLPYPVLLHLNLIHPHVKSSYPPACTRRVYGNTPSRLFCVFESSLVMGYFYIFPSPATPATTTCRTPLRLAGCMALWLSCRIVNNNTVGYTTGRPVIMIIILFLVAMLMALISSSPRAGHVMNANLWASGSRTGYNRWHTINWTSQMPSNTTNSRVRGWQPTGQWF